MNNNLKTKEQLVIEELERNFKNENIVVTEQEKKIAKLAEHVNPILYTFFTEFSENSKNNIPVDNMKFDKTQDMIEKAVVKFFSSLSNK